MYNRTKINTLVGLVGFENPSNPAYQKVDTTNQDSSSGRYVTDNPYCKIEYILDCQDYKDINKTDFNALLTKIQKSSLMNVCDEVFNNEDLLERDLIYPYEQNKVNLEILPDGFVGYKICKKANTAFKINRLFVEFSNIGELTLYLFSSNQPTALYEETITINTIGFQEITLTNEWIIDNTTNYEGNYYIGYVKGELIPYKRDYNLSNVMSYFDNIIIESIYVSDHSSALLFDQTKIQGMSENCGINIDITVYKDYTDWILRNKNIIATAVQMAAQIDVMRLLISSGRSNPTERITKTLIDKMIFEIEGNPDVKIYGLKNQYNNEIKKLRKSFHQEKVIILKTQE